MRAVIRFVRCLEGKVGSCVRLHGELVEAPNASSHGRGHSLPAGVSLASASGSESLPELLRP